MKMKAVSLLLQTRYRPARASLQHLCVLLWLVYQL